MKENWSEFLYYVETKQPFLQPTYFSFFGLFNIQRLGKSCPLTDHILTLFFCKIGTEVFRRDLHHFSEPSNFVEGNDGALRICDYGSKQTQSLITKHGQAMWNLFNPDSSWKEEVTK